MTSDDDFQLFRAAVGPVRPIRNTTPAQLGRSKPPARLYQSTLYHHHIHHYTPTAKQELLGSGDPYSFQRRNVCPTTFRRLKKGLFAVQDELDLHGLNFLQAEILLQRFLANAHVQHFGCVRIIHGKGLQSDTSMPILKNLVNRFLRRHHDVFAFHSAPQNQGGTGAVLVLLAGRNMPFDLES